MRVLIRGGGDLASGVAIRLHRAGIRVLITEIPQPLAVRRRVSFSEAVYDGSTQVEEVTAVRITAPEEAARVWRQGALAVFVDPGVDSRQHLRPHVLVDGRMTKEPPDLGMEAAPLVIGLGPGFEAGVNCHAAVETMRGHTLGRVLWEGAPLPDTGVPDAVMGMRAERVLRAPAEGVLRAHAEIGAHLHAGQVVAEVGGQTVHALFDGVLRGLVRPGVRVPAGMKIGDVDPRDDPTYCFLVSDKSLAVGGGVLEAILARPDLRQFLCSHPQDDALSRD